MMAGTTLIVLGLTWGGIRFTWESWQVLVPLLLGLVFLAGFVIYEAKIPKVPLVRDSRYYDVRSTDAHNRSQYKLCRTAQVSAVTFRLSSRISTCWVLYVRDLI